MYRGKTCAAGRTNQTSPFIAHSHRPQSRNHNTPPFSYSHSISCKLDAYNFLITFYYSNGHVIPEKPMETPIKIALSKGRIFKDALPLLAHAGIRPLDDPETSRKLILDTNQDAIKLVVIRAADVPTYVQYGAADLGIAGKDVLMEHGSDDIYEPVDLKIACCKMMVAGPKDHVSNITFEQTGKRLKIATKYTNSTRRYFAEKGIQVEIIKLYGSMELGPIVGLSDLIVDLVDTGNTLKANGLAPLEFITDISSRLIVNKASMKMKHKRVKHLISKLEEAVNKNNNVTGA